jgi:hypothetical protein
MNPLRAGLTWNSLPALAAPGLRRGGKKIATTTIARKLLTRAPAAADPTPAQA